MNTLKTAGVCLVIGIALFYVAGTMHLTKSDASPKMTQTTLSHRSNVSNTTSQATSIYGPPTIILSR